MRRPPKRPTHKYLRASAKVRSFDETANGKTKFNVST